MEDQRLQQPLTRYRTRKQDTQRLKLEAIRENNSVIRQQRKTQGRVELKVTHMGDANSVTTSGYIQSLTANMSRGTDAINNYMGNEVLPYFGSR